MKGFTNLPKDVIRLLFLNTSVETVYKILITNSKINKILNDLFWMNKVLLDYGKYGHDIPTKEFQEQNKFFCEQFIYNGKFIWKKYYKIINDFYRERKRFLQS